MKVESTGSPVCRVCEHRHRLGHPHIWADDPKKKAVEEVLASVPGVHKGTDIAEKCVHKAKDIAPCVHKKEPEAGECVHKDQKECVHNDKTGADVYTIREVGIRELRANITNEFKNLPFDVTYRGVVIAEVRGTENTGL